MRATSGRVESVVCPAKEAVGRTDNPSSVSTNVRAGCTEIIPNCERKTLQRIIFGKVALSSTIYSDCWSGYDGLVDVGYDRHVRLKHHRNEFARRRGAHVNGIEAFWSFCKRRLTKFNGVKKSFVLHLKECEWRWKKTTLELEKSLIIISKVLV